VHRPMVRLNLGKRSRCAIASHGNDVDEVLHADEIARIAGVQPSAMSVGGGRDQQVRPLASRVRAGPSLQCVGLNPLQLRAILHKDLPRQHEY